MTTMAGPGVRIGLALLCAGIAGTAAAQTVVNVSRQRRLEPSAERADPLQLDELSRNDRSGSRLWWL